MKLYQSRDWADKAYLREDPLAAARGILNALAMSAVIWAVAGAVWYYW